MTLRPLRTRISVPDSLRLLLVLGVVVVACFILYADEAGETVEELKGRERIRVSLLAREYRGRLRPVVNDLRHLSDGEGVNTYMTSGGQSGLTAAIRSARRFSLLNPDYDKVRLLGLGGREIVRINRSGEVVPPHEMQDKSVRPFFWRTVKLPPGGVYLSAFDLNVEEGVIEQPYHPTLRMALPVVGADGRTHGVYVINYRGEAMIHHLRQVLGAFASRLRVLNPEGYWIEAGKPGSEWGFALEERSRQTLAIQAPQLWARMSTEHSGQERHNGGLITWRRVTPGQCTGLPANQVAADEPFVIVASEVSKRDWEANLRDVRVLFGTSGCILLFLVAITYLMALSRDHDREVMRNSQEQLAVTLQSIGDAVLSADMDGRIIHLNPVAEKLTGWKLEDARGLVVETVFRAVNEKTREPAELPVRKVLATGLPGDLSTHTLLISRDGREIPVADSAAPIRKSGGRLLGVVMVFRDRTQERESEEALRKSAEEIRDLYNMAPCGYHSLDPEGTFIAINDTELAWLGRTRDEVIGKMNFKEILTPAGLETFRQNFPAFKKRGFVYDLEFDLVRKDGNRFPVLLSSSAIYDASGKYISSRSTLFDITERKKAEEERDRFFSLPLDILCVLSAEGVFQRVNPAFETILGWSKSEIEGKPFTNFITPEFRGKLLQSYRAQITQEAEVRSMDVPHLHKDGSVRVLSWNSYVMPGGTVYASARDVTEVRRAQDRLRQLKEALEAHSEQLSAANKELESFSYSVSHDLRAPLRHIQGYIGMLEKAIGKDLGEKPRRYLNTIASASAEMGQLIDDLLAFSRMGRVGMQESEVDLGALTEDVRERICAGVPDRKIQWNIAPLPLVLGDEAMLRQVLSNLLDNAVKYSSMREYARIDIDCCGEERDRAIIRVRDNGAGFDMRYAAKLFGVFQRLHRNDEFEGSGIGLATVRRIVARHGGRIWAEAVVDQGATFYFTLKRAGEMPSGWSPGEAAARPENDQA